MKQFICQFIFTIIAIHSVFAINPTFCVEDTIRSSRHQNPIKRKSISIGIPLTHFSPKSNNNGLDYEMRFINPGGEALIHYFVNNTISLSTGLSYQYNKTTLKESSPPDTKTITNEISIPVIATFKLSQATVFNLEMSVGFYMGQYISILEHSKPPKVMEPGTTYIRKKNYAELFSVDDFIGDIYVGIGSKSIFKKIPVGFDLFFRYRLKEHQLVNSEVSKALSGIKLKYELNL